MKRDRTIKIAFDKLSGEILDADVVFDKKIEAFEIAGRELYKERYTAIEPFYNGFALVTQFDNQKIIIDEKGNKILCV